MVTNQLVVDTQTSSSSYSVTLDEGRRYRWNVAACNSSGCSSFTTSLYFQTPGSVPSTPSNLSPGSTSSPGPTLTSRSVRLDWSSSSGTSYYDVGVRDLETNQLVVDTQTSSSSYSVTLDEGRRYRWNVAACNSSGCSSFTTPLYFQMSSGSVPTTPSNLSPGSTSSPGPTLSSRSVNLDWSSSSGTSYYEVGVRDLETNQLVVDTQTSSSSYAVTLDEGRRYRWNVAACNSTGCSSFAAHRYFQIEGDSTLLPPPDSIAPSNGATDVEIMPTFRWSGVQGADRYWLTVATQSGALPTNPEALSCPGCMISCNLADVSHSAGESCLSGTSRELDRGSTYFWRVQPWHTSGTNGSYSAISTFVTAAGSDPSQIQLLGLSLRHSGTSASQFRPLNERELFPEGEYVVFDGEKVKIGARLRNTGGAGSTTIRFEVNGAGLPGGAEKQATLAAGEEKLIEATWDSTGKAWNSSQPSSPFRFEVMAESGSSATAELNVAPRPLILVHGLRADASTWSNYESLARAEHGLWRAFAVGDGQAPGKMDTGGRLGTLVPLPIELNAERMMTYVESLREQHGIPRFDIVSHSMGGLISRYYVSALMTEQQGQTLIKSLVTLGTPHEGTRCASLLDSVGLFQLTPEWTEGFNHLHDDRQLRGVNLFAAGGDSHALCFIFRNTPSDGLVSFRSALLASTEKVSVADSYGTVLKHTAMTSSGEIFAEFVAPVLRGTSVWRGKVEDTLEVRRTEPEPYLMVNKRVEIPAGGVLEIPVLVGDDPGGLNFLLLSDDGTSATIISPQLEAFELIKHDLLSAKQIPSPSIGEWVLVLKNNRRTPASAIVSVSREHASTAAELEFQSLRVSPTRDLDLEVRLLNKGVPIKGASVEVELVGPGQTRFATILVDDGLGLDQLRGDGVYSGRFSRILRGGLHNVRVNARAPNVQVVGTKTIDVEAQPNWRCEGAAGLCLHDRFLISGYWRDPSGKEGEATALRLTDDAGYLTFFRKENPEVLVKVLDACAAFDRFWIFSTSLTNVEFGLRVEDTSDGTTYQVFNPLGNQPGPVLNTAGPFACGTAGSVGGTNFVNTREVAAPPAVEPDERLGTRTNPGSCRPAIGRACLQDGRFRVEALYRTKDNGKKVADLVRMSDDAAYATFFDRGNVELFVKILDACSWSGSNWVFVGGMTDVGVSLRVYDYWTGSSWELETVPGQTFPSVLDTNTVFTECRP